MNILMVSRFSILDRHAGTFRYIHDLSNELALRGHNVYWISKGEGVSLDHVHVEEIRKGYWIYRVGVKKSFSLWNSWQMMKKLRSLSEELDEKVGIDLICLHSMSAGPILSRSDLCKRVPFIGLYYAPVYFEYAFNQRKLIQNYLPPKKQIAQIKTWIYSKIQLGIERFILNRLEEIISLSQYSVHQLENHYSPDLVHKTIVIPAGVDIQRFSSISNKSDLRKRLGFPENVTIFFTLRNLMPRMGLEQLIEATGLLKKDSEDNTIILYIGGKGPLREQLQTKIVESGLERYIKMVGFIAEDELPAYYQASDFFVLPTEELEGFGIVTIEALSTNTPVVATPIGATPEIIEKTGGFLTRSAEPQDLAEKMQYVSDNREQILAEWDSRSVIEAEYSWQVVGDRIEKMFLDLHSAATSKLVN